MSGLSGIQGALRSPEGVGSTRSAEAFVYFFGGKVSFIRPALQAALELGAEEFMARLEAGITMGLGDFTDTLRIALPHADDRELRAVARSVRRLAFAGLLDSTMTQSELEQELRAALSGVSAGRTPALVAS